MKFNIGDEVEWSSQSQALRTKKRGTVVGIVPPHFHVGVEWPALRKRTAWALGRNHESYVVQVGKQYYWPLVVHLKEATR